MASYSYSHIARLQNRPTPLGPDFSRSLQWIAIGQPERQRRTGFSPNIPTPRSDRPKSFCDELFFFSSASLESVTGLRTCQEGGAITGMVLRYSNNTEKSLGWVRADRLGYLQEVCPDGLWILVTFFSQASLQVPSGHENHGEHPFCRFAQVSCNYVARPARVVVFSQAV